MHHKVSPREALVALNMLPKIGPVMVRRLIDLLGSPELVFSASRDHLMKVEGLGPKAAEVISEGPRPVPPRREHAPSCHPVFPAAVAEGVLGRPPVIKPVRVGSYPWSLDAG